MFRLLMFAGLGLAVAVSACAPVVEGRRPIPRTFSQQVADKLGLTPCGPEVGIEYGTPAFKECLNRQWAAYERGVADGLIEPLAN